jgi:hypothetical protein
MSTSAIRVLGVAALAAASLTCAENPAGLRRVNVAGFALAPEFAQAPSGGPDIDVSRVRGVLRSGTDSVVAEAAVQGDSAVLEFVGVPVTGDSTRYQLRVHAFDPANVLVFEAQQQVLVKPGANSPVEAVLQYVAPDAVAATIDITDAAVQLDWAGAASGDVSCLNRAPKENPVTQKQLSVTGQTAQGQPVAGVRVGWTSRDTTVATVSDAGLVRARCSNKSTWIVARSFLDKADSVQVTVTAPPFSLLMSPDSVNVSRGATVQLGAVLVDENGNTAPASTVNWQSSNTARATVSATGLVTGVTNGRVLVTARSGDRTTVAVVHVVRPPAAKVITIPEADNLAVGSVQVYYAKAADANNRIIGDATGFVWSSTNAAIASVEAATGVVKALDTGTLNIIASLDGKSDTLRLIVKTTLPGGTITGRILDAATDQPLAGVTLAAPQATATTDANGAFSLGGIQPGDDITVSKANYVTVTLFDAPVFRNFTLRIGDAGLPPVGGSGTLTGKVVNALNGQGISGITVKAYAGLNAAPSPKRPNVQPVATVTSGSGGVYTFSNVLAAGAYTLHFSGTGYSENLTIGSVVASTTETLSDVLLPPTTAGSGLVIVLTWGASGTNVPADLDAHLTGPDEAAASGRFHVYTGSRARVVSGDTIAALELDDTNFIGPEVVTLRASAAPGAYRFFVHDFSNRANGTSRALADSASARVDVYQNNRVIGTFFPPAGVAGTLWKVFEFDGARLFPVNTIQHQSDATTLPMIIGDSDALDVARIFSAIHALLK